MKDIERTKHLYPQNPGLKWAMENNHTINVMHFHMQSGTGSSRNQISWYESFDHDEFTVLTYNISGMQPVDHSPKGHVTQLFEATIQTEEGEVEYRETCDIWTDADGLNTGEAKKPLVRTDCSVILDLTNAYPLSITEYLHGKKVKDVIGGKHDLINAIGELTVLRITPLKKLDFKTRIEIDVTEWQDEVTRAHLMHELARPKRAARPTDISFNPASS